MPFAKNNGVRIHYEVEGNGPPIILHHGFGGTGDSWRAPGYVSELSQNNRVITFDARGCGQSDKPHDEKAYDFKNMVGDVIAVLDDLKLSKANYFGYSMGGRVGFRVAFYAQERFTSAILGGAVYPIKGTEDSQDDLLIYLQQALENAVKEAPNKPMEYYLAQMEKKFTFTPDQRARSLSNDPWALIASIHAFRGAVSPNIDEVLPRIKLPCLLFAGESDPRFPNVKECARRLPNAEFFSLPGLDHAQGLQQANLTLPHIMKFLKTVNNT
jgi:pimeloyl-ACP methyl ester carboxylesterase